MGSKAIWAHVCVWEPSHTLDRLHAQQEALRDGTISKLIKKHGEGSDVLAEAMAKAKLTTMRRASDGELHCAECGALMERLIAKDGVVNKMEAVRDIAQNFDDAIERTRAAR